MAENATTLVPVSTGPLAVRGVVAARPAAIVVIGGGFAGAYCTQKLEKLLGADAGRVVLIDRNNYFTFSPLLIEAGTGSLEPRHAVVSIRSFLKQASFRMGEVTGVDTAGRRVRFRPAESETEQELPYEHLVIAAGSVTSLPPVEGLREHGFEMKSLADAVSLRDRAVQMLEAADGEPDGAKRAAMLHFVVVGGSFTGVEVAGEFDVFLYQAAKRYRNLSPSECRVTLVERLDHILPALDRELADYAANRLSARNIELVMNSSVTRVSADHVELTGGRRLDTRTTIWCAGIAPSPLIKSLDLPKDPRGYLLCEPDLRVRGMRDVWAVGDCAVTCGPNGEAYPATAQHAVRQGVAAAVNIAATLRHAPTKPFVYESKGSLAPLGCRTAVAKVGPLRFSGLLAWMLWRTVYLMKMPGLTRKLRVALDWTLDLFFRRDYVQLGVHRATPRVEPVPPPPPAALPPRKVAVYLPPPPPPPSVSRPRINLAEAMAQAHLDEE